MHNRRVQPRNQLLAALPGATFARLRPHLEAVPLVGGSVHYELDEALTRVYFVETGVISLLTLSENRCTVGMGALGREGAVAVATLLLGGNTAPGRFQVLVPGSALAAEVPAFRSVLRQSSKLRTACEAHAKASLVEMLQAAACTKLHTVEQRCAYWLLMSADRTEDETFEIAQECLAGVLGVPQSMATTIAGALQREGLIHHGRCAIKVLDRPRLEAAACECYRIVRDRCERLLAHGFD